MTYTRAWTEDTPDGSLVDADDIDLEFQKLKVDIRERMETITGLGSFANDPISATTVREFLYSWQMGSMTTNNDSVPWGSQSTTGIGPYISPSGPAQGILWYLPVTFAAGDIITDITGYYYMGATGSPSATFSLIAVPLSTGISVVATGGGSYSPTGTGYVLKSSGVVAITIEADTLYYIKDNLISGSGSEVAGLLGYKITATLVSAL